MCYSKWISSCLRFHEFIGDKFEKWALLVDRRPKLISAICTILTLVLCSGFIFFDIYGQTERIFSLKIVYHLKISIAQKSISLIIYNMKNLFSYHQNRYYQQMSSKKLFIYMKESETYQV